MASSSSAPRSASDFRLKTIVALFESFWDRNVLLTPLIPTESLPKSYRFVFQSPFLIDYETRTQQCSVCFVRKPIDEIFPGFMFQFIRDGTSSWDAETEKKKEAGVPHDGIRFALLEHSTMSWALEQPHPNIDLGCMCSTACAAAVICAVQAFMVSRYQNTMLMPVLSANEYEKILIQDLVGTKQPCVKTVKPNEKKEEKKALKKPLIVVTKVNKVVRNEQIKEEQVNRKKRPRGGKKVRAARERKMAHDLRLIA